MKIFSCQQICRDLTSYCMCQFVVSISKIQRQISMLTSLPYFSFKVRFFPEWIVDGAAPLMLPAEKNMWNSGVHLGTQSRYKQQQNTHITIAACATDMSTSLSAAVPGTVPLPSLCVLYNSSPSLKNACDGPLWHALFAEGNLDPQSLALALISTPSIGGAAAVTNAS